MGENAMIYWLWYAFNPVKVHVVDLSEWWDSDDPDVYWLGECAWTGRTDNTGIGLK